MTNKIMELADAYAAINARFWSRDYPDVERPRVMQTRAALATEVLAQQDYTRAVIGERDALKAELKKEEDAHDADVNDLNYHLRNSINNHQQAEAELDALRKAAQMALKALEQAECGLSIGYGLTRVMVMDVIEALRKELEHG